MVLLKLVQAACVLQMHSIMMVKFPMIDSNFHNQVVIYVSNMQFAMKKQVITVMISLNFVIFQSLEPCRWLPSVYKTFLITYRISYIYSLSAIYVICYMYDFPPANCMKQSMLSII